jgi:F0F1-type ATP synthase assembly protein I
VSENDQAGALQLSDIVSAAMIGVIAGYLIARHSPEIEWVLHTLIG